MSCLCEYCGWGFPGVTALRCHHITCVRGPASNTGRIGAMSSASTEVAGGLPLWAYPDADPGEQAGFPGDEPSSSDEELEPWWALHSRARMRLFVWASRQKQLARDGFRELCCLMTVGSSSLLHCQLMFLTFAGPQL